MLSLACHAGNASRVARAFKTETGVALPKAGKTAWHEGMLILWSGLNQWFVQMDKANAAGAFAQLAPALNGRAAVTDQSDAFVMLELAGPLARETLARLCPIDLHPAVFKPGDTARTLAGHLAVQLALVGGGETGPVFQVLAARSSARDLVHDFEIAIASAGYG